MSRSSAVARRLCAVVAAFSTIAGGAAAASVPPPACERVLVSPAFARDRTLACVHPDAQGVRVVAVTTNAGKTWREAAMSGLVRPAGPTGYGLTATFSPAFAADHALFATTGSGTYMSTDLGATFSPVDALTTANASDNPVAFLGRPMSLPVGGDTSPRVLLAYAGAPLSALIDPSDGTRRPVLGVPGRGVLRFVVPPSSTAPDGALAVVNVPDTSVTDHAAIFRCDGSLTCGEPLFAFPTGTRFGPDSRISVLPDRSLLAVLVTDDLTPQVWRSTDGGTTFALVASVAKIVAAVRGDGVSPAVSVAAAASRPLYLRVEVTRPRTGWKAGAPAASQVFRSDDVGATWRLVAYGRALGQPGPRGTLPWRLGAASRQIQLAPDGRLFADGMSESVTTTWCSLDGGVRWTAGCAA